MCDTTHLDFQSGIIPKNAFDNLSETITSMGSVLFDDIPIKEEYSKMLTLLETLP